MSGTKRTLNNEENLDNTDQNLTPDSSPESKRLRHDSSHSESKDEDTQILDSENGFPDDQSSTSEDDDSVKQSIEETISDYALVDAKFDNGENDKFRYDGQVKLYIRVPTHPSRHEIISSPTIIRTLPWTLLGFFQRTFNSQQNESGKTFSLFLKCNVDTSIQNWSIFAKAEVTLLHPTDPSKNYIRKISHIFNSRSEDWGYNNFKLIKDVYSEYIHPSDHTIRIEANIHADPPRNIDWDSKGQTDFNGLRNIGATCYMNSFLQTIYFTKKLRKAVYTLPTDNDDQQHSIPLALQKVFYDLQFTDKVVSTRRLSRSFGWDKPDEFCQHDIQEFCRVLLDKLESKMQGTTMEGIIPSLYQGEYVQYVRCTNVDYESRVIETFYDVPLQVRNNQNITESFRDFCKKEILTGENLYDAGDVYGLQEAEKGVRFLKFPPVLCLHLLRFEYDYTLSQNRKINDNYSFDYQLDLSEFLEKPDCSSCSYKLLSVLVHSGDNSSGHYVSFLNPNLDGQWFKFDDDIVAHVSSADAMERNFGGVQDDDGTMFNTSAYMLVYIREDCQNDVLCEINFEHIPETLMKRFDNEKVLFNKRRANGFDNSIIDIPIILNDDFYVQPTACLSDIIHETSRDQLQKSYEIRYVRAQRNELFRVFAQRLAYELGVNLDEDIRIWFIHRHGFYFNNHCHSHSLQTYTLVHSDDYDKKLVDLIEYDQVDQRFVPIYIEQKILIDGSYQLLPYNQHDDVLVFVRLYNSRDESLLYIGHFLFPQQQSFQKCLNEITNRMKYPSSSSMNYLVHRSVPKHNRLHQYEAIKSINYDLSVSEILHPCSSGTSIIIQIYDSTEIPTTTVDDYLENLENRQEYDVWNRDSLKNECLFKLYLPLKASVKDVIRLISQRIDYPEEQIILQKPSISTLITNTLPSASLLHIGNEQILKDFYTNTRVNTTSSRKLTFKRLPFHYTELENRRLFRLNISDSIRRDQLKEFLFFPKSIDTISDFLNEIKQWIPGICSENVQCQLRIIELNLLNHVNPPFELRIFSEQTQINELNSQITRFYHLEEVSSDDIEQNKDIALIPVAFFVKENSVQINRQKFFPFFLHVIHNETYADVKHRLQRKLGLSNREFEKYRFSIYNGSKLLSKCDDNIGRINLRELKPIQKSCWLGVESPVITNSRKTRKSLFTEKPIRIN